MMEKYISANLYQKCLILCITSHHSTKCAQYEHKSLVTMSTYWVPVMNTFVQFTLKNSQVQIISKLNKKTRDYWLRNREHVPYFYRVIETRVQVWENEKYCGNTSHRWVFPQLFWVLPNFHECFYNLIETQSKCFYFF